MKPSLQLKLSQHLTLTPQLQQSIRLLQLSTVELNQELERYLAENPLLERADLSGEELSVRVLPRQADEFTCSRCFLVHHRSQLASNQGGQMVCRECAA